MMIFSGQRVGTLTGLKRQDCHINDDVCVIRISRVQKTSKPGKYLNMIRFQKFDELELCVLRHLIKYMELTDSLRVGESLLISFVKPHKAVSVDTVRRWIRTTISEKYKPHSLRAASTSAAARINPIDEIISAVGWNTEGTVARHYLKIIDKTSFSVAVVKGSSGHE